MRGASARRRTRRFSLLVRREMLQIGRDCGDMVAVVFLPSGWYLFNSGLSCVAPPSYKGSDTCRRVMSNVRGLTVEAKRQLAWIGHAQRKPWFLPRQSWMGGRPCGRRSMRRCVCQMGRCGRRLSGVGACLRQPCLLPGIWRVSQLARRMIGFSQFNFTLLCWVRKPRVT